MIFRGSDTDEYEGTRLPKTNTRVRAMRKKNADVSELYPNVEAIPKRMVQSPTEYGMICENTPDGGGCSPAMKYIGYATGVKSRWVGGFFPAGYWLKIVTGESNWSSYDKEAAINELANWFKIPVVAAEKLIDMPTRICLDWGDVYVDFGTEENLHNFGTLVTYNILDKRDELRCDLNSAIHSIDWGEEE
tara:strand:- start:225 stop:794 length:570 start_codon:yes stop_codon:yes gene_type:complete